VKAGGIRKGEKKTGSPYKLRVLLRNTTFKRGRRRVRKRNIHRFREGENKRQEI